MEPQASPPVRPPGCLLLLDIGASSLAQPQGTPDSSHSAFRATCAFVQVQVWDLAGAGEPAPLMQTLHTLVLFQDSGRPDLVAYACHQGMSSQGLLQACGACTHP